MTLAAGTGLLDASGRRLLLPDGRPKLSDGSNDGCDCCGCACHILAGDATGCSAASTPDTFRLVTADITLGTAPICVSCGGLTRHWCGLYSLADSTVPVSPNGFDRCATRSGSFWDVGDVAQSMAIALAPGTACEDVTCPHGLQGCDLSLQRQAGKWIAALGDTNGFYFWGEITQTDPADCCQTLVFANLFTALNVGTCVAVTGGSVVALAYGGSITATPCCEAGI